MRALILVIAAAIAAGCGPSVQKKAVAPPASTGVRALIEALRSNDPKPAYRLLSAEARKSITYEDFASVWQRSAKERKAQAHELEAGLRDNPNLGERSRVVFADGKSVHLLRESGEWKLDSALMTRSSATRPEEAVRMLAAALAARNFEGVMRLLTRRHRNGIGKQVDRFISSLIKNQSDGLQMLGDDRAELHWEDDFYRYKIVLLREGGEWRVDDVHLTAHPAKASSKF